MSGKVTTFPLFGKLPPEIRCEIWKYSAPGPRIVAIRYQLHSAQYISRIRTPSILSVNRESRQEAFKIYHELHLGPSRNTGCYVDLTQDSVYIKISLGSTTNQIHPFFSELDQHTRQPSPPLGEAAYFFAPSAAINPDDRFQTGPYEPRGWSTTNHSQIILDELMCSPDSEAILKNLYIERKTWGLVGRLYRRQRHHYPHPITRLTVVYERGHGRLPDIESHLQDIVMTGAEPLVGVLKPRYWDDDKSALKMRTSLCTTHRLLNMRDRKIGLRMVLTSAVFVKVLDRNRYYVERAGGDGVADSAEVLFE